MKLLGKKTVADRVYQYEANVNSKLRPFFEAAHATYPPQDVVLLYIKSQKTLSLFAKDLTNNFVLIKTYTVLAASGKSGPKLREGDYQVPEGVYGVEGLNPNSEYHLALRVNYPNADDLRHAHDDGRTKLGGDIMIHGSDASIGCLAMGDEAIEELFVLAAKSNYRKWQLIFAPVDFRKGEVAPPPRFAASWIPDRYAEIAKEMSKLP
ncbi:murein L,D-transpeptidase family protein [Bdellovibrio sp. NC01]|uniref:L,D-transpeptidase family protein n=1 Tax=Bdellovibrio sp. NC01 TaxID=2220073 RepID=UPI00115B282A|nr:L,D-transpeptidase family protein [Bdellovibrio sp. NC01]